MNKEHELLELLEDKGIDAVIITDPYNIRYYSGFTGGEGCYYVSAGRHMLITDSRYTLWAESECGKEEVYTAADRGRKILKQYIAEDNVTRLGLEGEHLTWGDYNGYVELFNNIENQNTDDSSTDNRNAYNYGTEYHGIEIVSVGDMINSLRMIKSEDEIEKIAAAESIGDAAFEYILGILRPGLTEREVALELELYMRKNGAERLSFDVIAASGPNSAKPHAMPSDRRLGSGEFLTMDFGCVYEGYCSDMTRTVVIGKANEQMKELYDTVLRAQMTALGSIHAGMTGKEADSLARDVIKEAGYGEYFGHGLGHSVGLYIHEEPRLSTGEDRILESGMVVTVEPGIYVPDIGGVRIEDVVVIEVDGIRNLTGSPKEMIEL